MINLIYCIKHTGTAMKSKHTHPGMHGEFAAGFCYGTSPRILNRNTYRMDFFFNQQQP